MDNNKKRTKLNQEIFLEHCKKIHENKYEYSNVVFINTHQKIKIICPEHGEFEQIAGNHYKGSGCPKCSKFYKMSLHDMVRECELKYESKYDYSLVDTKSEKVKIICPEHGIFEQTMRRHLNGIICPRCSGWRSVDKDEFIKLCNEKYDGKFDYSLVVYKNLSSKIKIICPEHGEFEQIANDHLKGIYGCHKCAGVHKLTTNEFMTRGNEIHNNKYDYSKVVYTKSWEKVTIICPEHGEFEQIARDHWNGTGCPKCSFEKSISDQEMMIYNELKDYFKTEQSNRTILVDGTEIDLLFNDKIGVEVNGIYWHSEKFGYHHKKHLNKTKLCAKVGIQLLHFWDYEINNKFDLVISMIKSKLGVFDIKLRSNKCSIKEVTQEIADKFLEENHIQGKCKSSVRYGLFYNDELVSIMTFGKPRFNTNYEWELIRFCSKMNNVIYGSASKLLNHFIKNDNPKNIISYANKRFSNGQLYEKIGFNKVGETEPNYFYFNGKNIVKRYEAQKHRLNILLGENFRSDLTEIENMLNAGYYRVWDCGNYIYELKNPLV